MSSNFYLLTFFSYLNKHYICEALEYLNIFHKLKNIFHKLKLFHSSDSNITVASKMAETDIWLRRAGTELLMAKGERLTCIQKVYREAAVDVSVI
jgi:hypothetical protein